MPNATYRYDVHKAFQIFFDPTYGLMHYLSKNLVSSFIPSGLHVNVVYDLPVCLAAMQAGRGERRPENAKGNGHFSRNPPSPCDAIPTLLERFKCKKVEMCLILENCDSCSGKEPV